MSMRGERERSAPNDAGFTLVEVLVASALIMIGLVAVVAGVPVAQQGIDGGRRQSTAVFLGEQRLEQIRAWASSTAAGQGFASIANGTPSTAPCCQAEGYGSIPGYGAYRREVHVSNGPTANTKNIEVRVFYQPLTAQGIRETRVQLATLLVSE